MTTISCAIGRRVLVAWLALAALMALRQSYRVYRTFAEATPPEPGPLPTPAPHVSIILPVRDEEANVDGVLALLLAQDYAAFDIAVIDDGSTDATPRLLAAWTTRDPRVRVHRVDILPEQWAGKAHALHMGAGLTAGEWLLFTDADTRHAPHTLRLMLGHAVRHHDDLLSMFPRLTYAGLGARVLMPIGGLLLTEWSTPAEVRDPAKSGALAVGQYMLLRRDAYGATGGYAAPGLRETFADDVELAQLFKRHGRRIDIVDGRELVANRQWTTWRSAWQGWRKSVYGEIAARPLLGLAGGLTLISYGLVPAAVLLRALLAGARRPTTPLDRRSRPRSRRRAAVAARILRDCPREPGVRKPRNGAVPLDYAAVALAATVLAAQINAHARFSRETGLSPLWALTAPVGWAAFGALLLDTARRILTDRGAPWRGRVMPHRAR